MILYTFLINAALAAHGLAADLADLSRQVLQRRNARAAAFVAAIVGGFNQVRGAIAGGLLVGVIDNLAAAYVSTAYRRPCRCACWC